VCVCVFGYSSLAQRCMIAMSSCGPVTGLKPATCVCTSEGPKLVVYMYVCYSLDFKCPSKANVLKA
jgi:hypothetical protein